MITNNRLDQSFGPVGSTAGVFMFMAGIIVTSFSLFGLVLVLLGAFVGFSSTSTIIKNDERKIKFSNNLFGIFRVGQWVRIEPGMKMGIKRSNRSWRAYSKSNQTLDIECKDFRIILYDSNNKQVMPVKKADNLDSAKEELEILSNQLGLILV